VLALGVGQRRDGAGDRPERADVAARLEAEHAADATEREVGVAIPGPVDGQNGRRAERDQVAVEITLQRGDVRAGAVGLRQRAAADHGLLALGRVWIAVPIAAAGELRFELLLEGGAVGLRARVLRIRAVGDRSADQAKRPYVADGFDAEDPAHALECEL
jgi:hypothetical protein